MKIPVLTYHSVNVNGCDYASNDHLAFEQDLQLIESLNIKVISVKSLHQWLIGELELDPTQKHVVLTFDDGCDLDHRDWEHPQFGELKSFYNCLKDHPGFHATSFVIASPSARKELVKTCLAGNPLWGDDWWQEVEDSGLISIENHSWDHLHHSLDQVSHSSNCKGDFSQVQSLQDAQAQITQANEYIDSKIEGKTTRFFAYPYGHVSSYLLDEFFPQQQSQIIAAFSCEPRYVEKDSFLWNLPRFVCGQDWKSESSLKRILLQMDC